MSEGKNRQWILNARPEGKLTGEEFRWNEAPILKPSDEATLVDGKVDDRTFKMISE